MQGGHRHKPSATLRSIRHLHRQPCILKEESHPDSRSSSPEQHDKQPSGLAWVSSPHASEIALLEQLSLTRNTETFRNNEVLPSSSAWIYPCPSSKRKLPGQLCRIHNTERLRNNEALPSSPAWIPSHSTSEMRLLEQLCGSYVSPRTLRKWTTEGRSPRLVRTYHHAQHASLPLPPARWSFWNSCTRPSTSRIRTVEGRSPSPVRTYHQAQRGITPLPPVR